MSEVKLSVKKNWIEAKKKVDKFMVNIIPLLEWSLPFGLGVLSIYQVDEFPEDLQYTIDIPLTNVKIIVTVTVLTFFKVSVGLH